MKQRKPNRLKDYDYSMGGWYFVTICTHKKIHHFGNVENGKMSLNPYGEIAAQLWLEIPKHFNLTELDQHVVMPNHVHGIIIIHDVGDAYMHYNKHLGNNRNANLRSLRDRTKMLLSKAVQQYKAAVTREINRRQIGKKFHWQKSFYDHIIRNDISLFNIRKYIQNNPLKWEYDQENLNGISIEEKKKFWDDFFRKQF